MATTTSISDGSSSSSSRSSIDSSSDRSSRSNSSRRKQNSSSARGDGDTNNKKIRLGTSYAGLSHAIETAEATWEDREEDCDMLTARSNFAAVVVEEDEIWVFGGKGEHGEVHNSAGRVTVDLCQQRASSSNNGTAAIATAQPQKAVVRWRSLRDMSKRCFSFGGAVVKLSNGDEGRRAVVLAGGCRRDGGHRIGGYSYLNGAEMLDCATHTWVSLPSLKHKRFGCAVASCHGLTIDGMWDGLVFVVGGGGGLGTHPHNTVEYYNANSPTTGGLAPVLGSFKSPPEGNAGPAGRRGDAAKSWTMLQPNMEIGRRFCAAVVMPAPPKKDDDATVTTSTPLLVVLGGETVDGRGSATDSVEAFNFATHQWSFLPPMMEARSNFAAVVLDSCIYVMGGTSTHGRILASVEIYDARTNQWTMLPNPMTTPRAGCAAVVIQRHIVVLGGFSAPDAPCLKSVEVLPIPTADPDAKKSKSLPTLPAIEGTSVGRSGRAKTLEGWCSVATGMLTEVKEKLNKALDVTKKCKDAQVKAAEEEFERGVEALREKLNDRKRKAEDELDDKGRTLQGTLGTWVTDTEIQIGRAGEELRFLRPPPELVCPVTGELMTDPVMTMDGQTYERRAIEEWFGKFPFGVLPTSPCTNTALVSTTLVPNLMAKSLCGSFRNKQPMLRM